jgi:phthalate 4,5-dioxygenase oxygenase subunit
LLEHAEVTYRVFQRECNWLQALEGDIDTSHFGFLHAGSVNAADLDLCEPSRFAILDKRPDYHVTESEWGTTYAAHRPADPGQTFYRVAHFLFPFWTYLPEGVFRDNVIAQAWVPMDDTHTMVYQLAWKKRSPPARSLKEGRMIPGLEPKYDYLPNTSDWYGRWRFVANRENDYLIDRDAQRTVSFTGITGVSIQDQAITESMGGITDHSWEHLVPSDRMITATRRRLVKAALALEKDGAIPPGVDNPEICLAARAGSFVAPKEVPWRHAYSKELAAALNPTQRLQTVTDGGSATQP